ncbi:MAG: hypothetical protein ACTSQS_14910 [Promethearchaeota archaeon]
MELKEFGNYLIGEITSKELIEKIKIKKEYIKEKILKAKNLIIIIGNTQINGYLLVLQKITKKVKSEPLFVNKNLTIFERI